MLAFTVPWREIPDDDEPGSGSAGPGDSDRSMNVEVLFKDEQTFIEEAIGFSSVNGTGATRTMSRTLPQSHPRKPWLRCIRTGDVRGRVPLFQQNAVPGGATFAADDLGEEYYRVNSGSYGPYMPYKFSRMRLDFRTLNLGQILDDTTLVATFGGTDVNGNAVTVASPANVGLNNSGATSLRRESYRYVMQREEHSVETIQLPQGKFVYWQSPNQAFRPDGANADQGLPKVTPTIRQPIATLCWDWYDVPEAYLHDQYGIAANILAGDECINQYVFHGFPAGTLLCLQPKVEPQVSIASPLSIGLTAQLNVTPRMYKVSFRLKYFDPPTPNGYPYRGHNLVPGPRKGGNYFVLTSNPNPAVAGADDLLYRSFDFEKFFQPPATMPPVPAG